MLFRQRPEIVFFLLKRGVILSEWTFQQLNQSAKEIWDKNAKFWDYNMQEGNSFHTKLIEPAQLSLLDLSPGETILDIGCGNGQFARRMARYGINVTALDISKEMIRLAKKRTVENTNLIKFLVIDVSSPEELAHLNQYTFDKAVSTMSLMDIGSIRPLISSLARLLPPKGIFVFSICHPCFNTPSKKRIVEKIESENNRNEILSVNISDYITPTVQKGVFAEGQPVDHYYFNRPISDIFNSFFEEGFALNGIYEPAFKQDDITTDTLWSSWEYFTEIPPVLVARMILLK